MTSRFESARFSERATMPSNSTNTSFQFLAISSNEQSSSALTCNNMLPVVFISSFFVFYFYRWAYQICVSKAPSQSSVENPRVVVASMVSGTKI